MTNIIRRGGIILLCLLLTVAIAGKLHDLFAPKHATLATPLPVTTPETDFPTGDTPPAVDRNEADVLIDVPYLHQNAYPTGCESVSAVMALQYWGVDISVDDFIDNYLHCRPLKTKNGVTVGSSPHKAFIGDPRTTYGFGCYVEPIGLACYKLAGDDLQVLNRSGVSLEELTARYIDFDIPVLIWATINMVEPYPSAKWIDEQDGTEVEWIANEHCLVLVGYDEEHYYCNDPYANNGVVAYDRELLEKRYAQMGQQALVLRPGE